MLVHVEHGCCGFDWRNVDRAVALYVPAKQSCLRDWARKWVLDGEILGHGEEGYFCRWCDGGFDRLSGLFAHEEAGACESRAVMFDEVVREALERPDSRQSILDEMLSKRNGGFQSLGDCGIARF